MASTSQKTKKGILKHSGSIDHSKKELEWDEMNIMATYHPADKDYGFMKVDEPPTPYNRAAISDSEDDHATMERKGSTSSVDALDPAKLAERLEETGESSADRHFYDDDDDSEEERENETEEEKKRRKAFVLKRKMHYNEFQAVQLAKKLMAEEEDDDEDDDDAPKNVDAEPRSSSVDPGTQEAASATTCVPSAAEASSNQIEDGDSVDP
ncbi:protein phosphatase inhibitor 2 [Aplysia californica]|uniref:Protein phosphatase inhibitor 2 n=1 Tax=Aplysia californica TaxID=6500 RepID=A0ABM0JMC8_APLCA|nr:protein phosphatase inhibitor 2 [Aplysia californica]